MSRKDAKAAKKKKQYFLSELGVLRALAGGISESEMFMYRKFAQAAKIFKHSSTEIGVFVYQEYFTCRPRVRPR